MSPQSNDALKAQREALWASMDAVILQRDAAIDVLKQWASAADSGDRDELRATINNRDEMLRRI